MATEAEVKAQERRELLNDIRRRRAAAAQAEGSVRAAEEGQYGDVGQGGPKGEFDDEINQDPSQSSMTQQAKNFLANYFTNAKFGATGAGIEGMARIQSFLADKKIPFTDKDVTDIFMLISQAPDRETFTKEDIGKVIGMGEFVTEDMVGKNKPLTVGQVPGYLGNLVFGGTAEDMRKVRDEGLTVDNMTPGQKASMAAGFSEFTPFGLAPDIFRLGKAGINTGIKAIDDMITPLNQMQTAGGPNVNMMVNLSEEGSGNVKTKMGPAPKNLTEEADKWLQNNPNASAKKAMEVFLNESDKYLKTGIVNERNIKDRRKTLGISSPEGKNINKLSAERKENTFTDFKSNLEGVDMNDPQAVLDVFRNSYKKGYAETTAAKQYEETGSLSQSQSANKKINDLIDEFENTEGGFKISKQNEIDKLKPKKKDTSDIYAEYYRKEFSPNTAVINVKKSSEFRFFNNKRRTLDDQTPQEFFSQYSLKDIEKGGKFHNEYLQFKAIDDVRIKNVENLQPILRKIFTKVREGTPNQKESLVNLNIAHKFESSGIKKGYVSPTKTGKGTDPTEIYIDVSEYNQTIQPSLEAEARKFYNKYIEFGDEAARKEYLKIDKDMKILGIEGQVAPGQTVGKAMPFDDKIRQLADEAINNNFITQTEYDQLINSAEEIAQSKIDFFNTFGIKSKYASGGLVGIDHLTRPL
jgi:hypothetical protein